MQFIVREAQREDIEGIVAFQRAMARETEELTLNDESLLHGVKAVFDDPAKGKYYVSTASDKLIASTLLTPEWSDWRNGYVYWIQSVYVLPEFRGKKVFTQIYNHIKKVTSADSQSMGLRLYVDKTNVKAQKVYEKLGMNGEHYKLYEWMK